MRELVKVVWLYSANTETASIEEISALWLPFSIILCEVDIG
jgi:hypothetical protein